MKRMGRTKTFLVLAMVVVMLACTIGGTVAYLTTKTADVVNTFTPAKVTCAVYETFDGAKKENVQIKNTGNTDAWIRATVVGNWVKDSKIVAAWTDNINYNTSVWAQGFDGYYYYNSTVSASGSTKNLFDSYTAGEAPVEGAHLELTIVCQAVQSNLGNTAQAAFAAAAIKGGAQQ